VEVATVPAGQPCVVAPEVAGREWWAGLGRGGCGCTFDWTFSCVDAFELVGLPPDPPQPAMAIAAAAALAVMARKSIREE